MKNPLRRLVASTLGACLALAAPGPGAYHAVAEAKAFSSRPEPVSSAGVSRGPGFLGVQPLGVESLQLPGLLGPQDLSRPETAVPDPSRIDPLAAQTQSPAPVLESSVAPAREPVSAEPSAASKPTHLNVPDRAASGSGGHGEESLGEDGAPQKGPAILAPLAGYVGIVSAPGALPDAQREEVEKLYEGRGNRRGASLVGAAAASVAGAVLLANPGAARADEKAGEGRAEVKVPPRDAQGFPQAHGEGILFVLGALLAAAVAARPLARLAARIPSVASILPRGLPRPGEVLVMIGGSAILAASYSYLISSLGAGPNLNPMSGLLAFFSLKQLLRRKGHTADQNNLIQSPMTMASGTNWMIVGIIAMGMQGLSLPAWVWATTLILANYLGILLAIPFRSHFVDHESSGFPMGRANGTLQPILVDPRGSGATSAKALGLAGAVAAVFVALKEAFGLIPKVLFSNQYSLGLGSSLMTFSVGTLISVRTAIWAAIASLLMWGAVAPLLMGGWTGVDVKWLPENLAHVANGSPYTVLLMNVTMWVGTAFLLAQNLTSLLLNWRSLSRSLKFLASGENGASEYSLMRVLPAVAGLTVLLSLVLFVGAGISPWITVLAVLVSIPLMLVGVKVQAEVGLTPISSLAFLTLILSSLLPGAGLMGMMVASIITATMVTSSSVMMNDMKTAAMVGSEPKSVFWRHILIGVPVGVLTMVLIYPILSAKGFGENGLPAPMSRTWQGMATLLNMGLGTLPAALWIAVLAAIAGGIALAVAEKRWDPSKIPWWVPSATGIGLALLLPGHVMLLMAAGAIFALALGKFRPKVKETYHLPIATGFIAVEAVGILIIALLKGWGIL